MRFIPVLVFFLLAVFCSFNLSAQYIFKGKVQSTEGQKPLQGVTVSVDNNIVAVTDSNGVFEFNNTKERSTLYFSYTGYEGASAASTSRQNPVITLYPSAGILS